MEKLNFGRENQDKESKILLKDSEFLLVKAIENLTEAIITLQSRMK